MLATILGLRILAEFRCNVRNDKSFQNASDDFVFRVIQSSANIISDTDMKPSQSLEYPFFKKYKTYNLYYSLYRRSR